MVNHRKPCEDFVVSEKFCNFAPDDNETADT
jgi:hypothetical protein